MAKGRRKAEDRQIKIAHRKHRREQSRMDGSQTKGDFVSLRNQLEVMGLTLREVPGDGNCLFRALSDQLHGTSEEHANYRQDVVNFMRQHVSDYEPFLVDEPSFDRHLELLAQDGTFGGNDSIVAFSRMLTVTVVIHQLNEPLWQVHGSPDGSSCPMELHISYHNGDHYNSVRRIGDRLGIGPANIKINSMVQDSKPNEAMINCNGYDDNEGALSDYENATATELENIRAVMRLSGIDDTVSVTNALAQNADCVEAAVDYLLQMQSATKSQHANSNGIWSENGTGSRILGSDVANDALKGSNSTNNDRLASVKSRLKNSNSHLTNKKKKQLKKIEKKLTADQRKVRDLHQNKGDKTEADPVIVSNLQTLSI
ncbi:OTU domain-containing protein 3-like [Tigriopus californicus]|uniref:OTU domain-containing protein 3-like n=1 Tax=Tigriopus californicus TaxID=6832 RepID=UPI0027D9F96C|nr:OTU domain-containing protein 3-like [Tigriopus californicus]